MRTDMLREKPAEYGDRIVYAVSRELTSNCGRGFSEKNLWHMIRFAEAFPDGQIVNALSTQLGWTH